MNGVFRKVWEGKQRSEALRPNSSPQTIPLFPSPSFRPHVKKVLLFFSFTQESVALSR